MEALIIKLLHTIGAGIASDVAEFTLEKGEEWLKETLDDDDFKTLDRIVDIDESQVHSTVHDLLKEKISLPF
tara:strand:+ start:577 stop:792 length:216 start_codon:yes stop_codon:yes gene_type:complete